MSNKMFLSIGSLYKWNENLFDDCIFPEQIDRETLINKLILDTMQIDCLYSDPEFLQAAFGMFCKARIHTWEKIAFTLYHDYNPFINFTRDEKRETDYSPNIKTEDVQSGAAWNEESMIEKNKNDRSVTGNAKTVETFHSEGDSAMYTPTDVAKKEFELRAQADVIEFIINDFKKQFCLCIY